MTMRDATQFARRAELAAIHTAVPGVCDGKDGLGDGLVQQPQRCSFHPAVVACPQGADGDTCLTVVDRTMPLCPHPQVARYKRTRDVKDGARFACGAP